MTEMNEVNDSIVIHDYYCHTCQRVLEDVEVRDCLDLGHAVARRVRHVGSAHHVRSQMESFL